jgi:hypothetical protein
MSEYYSPSENPKIGDIVQIKEYMGKAIINLRDTVVETFQGKQLLFLTRVFQIRSKTTRFYKRRFDLSVGFRMVTILKSKTNYHRCCELNRRAIARRSCKCILCRIWWQFCQFICSNVDQHTRARSIKSGKWGYHPHQKKHTMLMILVIPFPIRTLDFGIRVASH